MLYHIEKYLQATHTNSLIGMHKSETARFGNRYFESCQVDSLFFYIFVNCKSKSFNACLIVDLNTYKCLHYSFASVYFEDSYIAILCN